MVNTVTIMLSGIWLLSGKPSGRQLPSLLAMIPPRLSLLPRIKRPTLVLQVNSSSHLLARAALRLPLFRLSPRHQLPLSALRSLPTRPRLHRLRRRRPHLLMWQHQPSRLQNSLPFRQAAALTSRHPLHLPLALVVARATMESRSISSSRVRSRTTTQR